ncbi:8043_t:CDS:2, partial [Gigaspora rosea]
MMRGTEIVEIRVVVKETFFVNDQGETANLSLPGGILAPEGTLAERLDTICGNILLGECEQIDLLQQYYHLGECLVEIAGSLEGSSRSVMAHEACQTRIGGNKGKEVWRVA